MISFYLLWTACYFVWLHLLFKKWPKTAPEVKFEEELPSVTLLIPFRNELENLDKLVLELQKIDYPGLKIFLIDDQSEDGSFDFLQEMLESDPRVKLIQSPGFGKKEAIEFGVKAAVSELILCSDADCGFPKDWVYQMISPFADPKINLVAGPVISSDGHTFFERFQQIEWSSILVVTQYFFSKKHPILCSAANLAYRKSAFERVSGFEGNKSYLSGDDEFLLKKISSQFGSESCQYLPFAKNLVYTKPQNSLQDLINQRIRWAGKWAVHRDFRHAFSAVFSFFIQLGWLSSLFLLGFGRLGIVTFLVVWFGKILAEHQALGKVLRSLGMKFPFWDYLKTGVLHPIYVISVALGAIRGKFTWKGRSN